MYMAQCVFCNGSVAAALGNILTSWPSLAMDSETNMCHLLCCTGHWIAIHVSSAAEVMSLGGEVVNIVYCSLLYVGTLEEVKEERLLWGRKQEIIFFPTGEFGYSPLTAWFHSLMGRLFSYIHILIQIPSRRRTDQRGMALNRKRIGLGHKLGGSSLLWRWWAMEQDAQRGCGCPFPKSVGGQIGWDSEQRGVVEDIPAHERGLEQDDL